MTTTTTTTTTEWVDRDRIIEECIRLLEATPTDTLVSYLSVLGKYATKPRQPVLRLV